MTIAVKSEIDSRVVVYPLMWALKSFGSILVVSSNRQLRRLVDDAEYSTFRDIAVIVDEEGGTDDVFSLYGVVKGDYDFVVLDNVGSIDFDYQLVLLGNKQSDVFMSDLDTMQESEDRSRYILLDFGNGLAAKEQEKVKVESKKAGKKVADNVKTAEGDYDPADKFRAMVPGEEDKKDRIKPFKVKFPAFADIEQVEADHKFYQVGLDLTKAFFSFLGGPLAVSMDKFNKVVRRKDESSSNGKKG